MSEKAAVIKGHGHVTPNADGYLARCGGPTICKVCKAELATLKAQPSGVVHHNLIEALKFYANGDHLLLADPDAWDTCSGEPINFLHDDAGTASVEDGSIAKAALDSLNSSPVSAGDDAEQAAFEAWLVRVCPSGDADSVHAQWLESSDYEDFCDQAYDAEAERLTAEALGVGAGINPNATSIDDIFLSESAGGVDERAAFEVEIPAIAATFDGLYLTPVIPLKAGEHLMTVAQHLRIEKQIRAALSAPSHGEQVRAVVPEEWRTMLSRVVDELDSLNCNMRDQIDDDMADPDEEAELCDATDELIDEARALIAAAPSAASQEQG
jgi:hypothetical protein